MGQMKGAVSDAVAFCLHRRNQVQSIPENVRKMPKLPNLSPQAIKHLWIRTALFDKVLDKIVHYLVENSR